jgi:hypothetical protein
MKIAGENLSNCGFSCSNGSVKEDLHNWVPVLRGL